MTNHQSPITNHQSLILVPQGAEYKSVCRGLSLAQVSSPAISTPPVFPIPVGVKPLTKYLEKWLEVGNLQKLQQPKVLLMGLCGSLSPRYSVGDVVLYESCVYQGDVASTKLCELGESPDPVSPDRSFTTQLYNHLKPKVSLVRSLTSDRLIYSASEKRHLGETYNAEVVDMEGFAANKVLSKAGVAVAMLRVISDDCHHNLPNLNSAISPDGSLKSLPLAIGMLRQPIASLRLIKGSLHALRVLQKSAKFISI